MTYRFKPLPELYWGVLTALALVVLPVLVTLDPAAITDWRTWAVALGGAAVRAAAGAALDYVRRSVTAEPEPTLAERILALGPDDMRALNDEIVEQRTHTPPSPPPPGTNPYRSDVRFG